jgi:predicted metal-dependent hydrolase
MEAPIAFWQGIEQFNQREFYACHDTLEALWIEAMEPDKKFYQGILQIAVGLYHLGNQNWRGAVILLGEGMHRLQGYPDDYHGINVEHLLEQTNQILKLLHKTGPEQVAIVLQQLGYEPPIDRPNPTATPGLSLPMIQKVAS